MNINQIIATGLSVSLQQVEAAVKLLDEGATVPFIARYRKELTGSLDDAQLRHLNEQLCYLRELTERKQTILKSIESQGKLTEALTKQIEAVTSKSELEDIYLPYKPKRRTKAQIAREAGLEPLADGLLADPSQQPEQLAAEFLNKEHGIETAEQALDGAKQILMERFAEDPETTKFGRETLWNHAALKSEVADASIKDASKFQDYFEYQEPIRKIPSHRALALFRGRQLGVLRVSFELDEAQHQQCRDFICEQFQVSNQQRPADSWLLQAVDWAWRIKLLTRMEVDCLLRLRELAEEQAISVFSENLHDLLMAAPAGAKVTMGLDPGYRTGVKVVVVDATGKLLANTAIFPHAPQKQWDRSLQTLHSLCSKHQVELVSIGNGTASRETDQLVAELAKRHPDLRLTKIVVSEAGASVYSASEQGSAEFPDLDATVRGAISIARRLQDPLAELVKIDPKAIGVGQYQHDVNQSHLAKSLLSVMEHCVNEVGVDLNRASVPLLAQVAGLNSSTAKSIVAYREQHGAFDSRDKLLQVPRLGDKTFQQCAGFLRITDGSNPLDASGVHPEAYPVVMKIIEAQNMPIEQLIGNEQALQNIKPNDFVSDQFGLPTVVDIIKELQKPGRDPRPEFKMAKLKEGVETIKDVLPGMRLEGTVSNVTHFGAFVDIGVHQDGLVHKSQLADRFVETPSDVVKVGQIVSVQVLEVDLERKRISLTMKSKPNQSGNRPAPTKSKTRSSTPPKEMGQMAAALQKAFAK